MSNQRRIGTVEVTEVRRVPEGGVDVLLARSGDAESRTRIVIHFHVPVVAEAHFMVGQRFDLILEPTPVDR